MKPIVLIVEDNPDNMALMEYLLRAEGYDPLLARSGEEGLAVARRAAPSLVLLDIQLPGIDGVETLRLMREVAELSETPVAAVTSFAMVGDRERLLAAGFDAYLSKPIDPETFVGDVEGLIGAAEAER